MAFKFTQEKERKKDVFTSVVAGNEFTLKTGTMLETEDPTVLISTDMGYTAAVNRAIKMGRKIHVEKFALPELKIGAYQIGEGVNFDHEAAIKTWKNYKAFIAEIVRDKSIRSIVVDTGTDVQRLARAAHFGKLTQVKPHHYGQVNEDFTQVHDLLLFENGCDKNVHIIHHLKKVYVKGKNDEGVWNGEWELAGADSLLKAADVIVWCEQIGTIGNRGQQNVRWTIQKCRDNPTMVGAELYWLMEGENGEAVESGELSYQNLRDLVMP